MLNAILILLFLLLLYYLAAQGAMTVGLLRLRFDRNLVRPSVSVIVAARNEETSIGRLLQAVSMQTVSPLEIIIANDRSSDRTVEIVRAFASRNPLIRCIDVVPKEGIPAGKKNALAQAIQASTGEILCLTDADSVPGSHWIEEMCVAYNEDVGFVAGGSIIDCSLLRSEDLPLPVSLLRFVEFLQLRNAISSAAAIGIGQAWLCIGSNLSFRRSVYEQVGGYAKIMHSLSGDDDLFLQLIRRTTDWKVRYLTSSESRVRTAPPSTWNGFFTQRRRHFSAGRYYGPLLKIHHTLIQAASLLSIAVIPAGIMDPQATILLYAFPIKLLLDAMLFVAGARILGWNISPGAFAVSASLEPIYTLITGMTGLLTRPQWKQEIARD